MERCVFVGASIDIGSIDDHAIGLPAVLVYRGNSTVRFYRAFDQAFTEGDADPRGEGLDVHPGRCE